MSVIPTTDEHATERERFHEWCGRQGIDTDLWLKNQPWCGYANSRTNDYWQGWLGRAGADGVPERLEGQPK